MSEEKDQKIKELEDTILKLRIEIRDLKNQLYHKNRSNKLNREDHEYNVDDGSSRDY